MKKIPVILLILVLAAATVPADIPSGISGKQYTPTFEEWLQVYLSTFNATGRGYFLDVVVMPTEQRGSRIILMGYVNLAEYEASDWYRNALPTIMKSIELQCESFSQRGYPIDYVQDVQSMIHVRGAIGKNPAGPEYALEEGQ